MVNRRRANSEKPCTVNLPIFTILVYLTRVPVTAMSTTLNRLAAATLIATFAAAALCNDAAAQQIRRWVDADGVVHFGEFVPPEFAHSDREVLNSQGVVVGYEKGESSDEERAELERQAREEEQKKRDAAEAAHRDRVLLDTYLSVEDIEDLRDRRLEIMESQIKVTEQYLANLRKRLTGLEREAARLAERNADEDGLPAELTLDISRTQASIALYEENLVRARSEQTELHAAFAADITRFIELKGARAQNSL